MIMVIMLNITYFMVAMPVAKYFTCITKMTSVHYLKGFYSHFAVQETETQSNTLLKVSSIFEP